MQSDNRTAINELIIPLDPLKRFCTINFYSSSTKTKEEQESALFYADINYSGAGKGYKPLQKEELDVMLRSVTDNLEFNDFRRIGRQLPNGIIYFDFVTFNRFAWIMPKGIKTLHFSMGSINGSFNIMLPNLLFLVNDEKLHVFVIGEYKGDDTIIYENPFMNVYANNSVCIGRQDEVRTVYQFNSIPKYFEQWENIFINSPFTGDLSSSQPFLKETLTMRDAWKIFIKKKRLETRMLKRKKLKISDICR